MCVCLPDDCQATFVTVVVVVVGLLVVDFCALQALEVKQFRRQLEHGREQVSRLSWGQFSACML